MFVATNNVKKGYYGFGLQAFIPGNNYDHVLDQLVTALPELECYADPEPPNGFLYMYNHPTGNSPLIDQIQLTLGVNTYEKEMRPTKRFFGIKTKYKPHFEFEFLAYAENKVVLDAAAIELLTRRPQLNIKSKKVTNDNERFKIIQQLTSRLETYCEDMYRGNEYTLHKIRRQHYNPF